MKGSLVNRNGHYSAVLEDKDLVTGKRKQQWVNVGTDFREAEKKLNKLVHSFNDGSFIKPTKLTVKSHFDQWLTDYVAANLSPRTHELYKYICEKHIYPALGQTALSALKPQQVQKLHADKKLAGLSNRTCQIIHNVLHKGLDNAIKTGLIVRNVLDAVEYPKIQRYEIKTLTDTDILILLEYARESEYYPLWYTVIFTGMRRSEALALTWGDIDLENKKISVNKTMQYLDSAKSGEKIKFKAPKTEKSRRYAAMTPSNAAVLQEHKDAKNKTRKALGLNTDVEDSDLVFCHPDGSPYTPNGITHSCIRLVRKCGLKGVRLHDCRHSYASLLLRQNVHPSIVAAQLGHASVTTTLNIYSHVTPALQEQAASQFDNIVLPGIIR
jgi:integrase